MNWMKFWQLILNCQVGESCWLLHFQNAVGLVVGLLNLCSLPKLAQTHISQNEDFSQKSCHFLNSDELTILGKVDVCVVCCELNLI